jgi:hypothetical protein
LVGDRGAGQRDLRLFQMVYDSYIRVLLEESPSLKPELEQKLSDAYRRAKIEAERQIGISEDRFPEICPFTLEEILDNEF